MCPSYRCQHLCRKVRHKLHTTQTRKNTHVKPPTHAHTSTSTTKTSLTQHSHHTRTFGHIHTTHTYTYTFPQSRVADRHRTPCHQPGDNSRHVETTPLSTALLPFHICYCAVPCEICKHWGQFRYYNYTICIIILWYMTFFEEKKCLWSCAFMCVRVFDVILSLVVFGLVCMVRSKYFLLFPSSVFSLPTCSLCPVHNSLQRSLR